MNGNISYSIMYKMWLLPLPVSLG